MDEKSVLSELDKLILTGNQLGLFEDREGRQLLKCARHGVLDPFIVDRIQRRVETTLRRRAMSGCPFPDPKLHRGDFVFGFDLWDRELRTQLQYSNAHTLMLGGSGAGKSNASKYRAVQIVPHVRGVWLIDIRKREFRSLRYILAQMGIDLKIIRCRQFRVNPLQVPRGVEPTEYAAVAADFLVRVFNLPPRASTLLRSTIIRLYAKHGVLDGGERYPTLFDLFEAIRANREANPQARQAVLDNLEAVLLTLGPEMLAYHRGWDVHELARQHLVMELTGLPEAGKDLILNYLPTAEFTPRIARGVSNPRMDLWICFDEAQRLFSQKRETNSYGGNALIDLTGLVRGTGIGLEISVLTTHDLSTAIPNLTATKILGRCGSMGEYRTAGQFLGLSSEQIMWCAHHLVPGLFVGQIGEGPWRFPFVFRVPWVGQRRQRPTDAQKSDNIADGLYTGRERPATESPGTEVPTVDRTNVVTDSEADKSLESLRTGLVVPATGIRPLLRSGPSMVTIADSGQATRTRAELRLLRAVVEHPLRPSSEYPGLARISPNTFQKLRPDLIRRGLIKVRKLESGGRRGRGTLRLEPTDAARKLLSASDGNES